jgi:MFS family permease
VIGNHPEDYGLEPDGASPDPKRVTESKREFTAQEALRTRAFWAISIGHGLALMVVFSVLVHLVVHLNEGLGFSLQQAGTIVAIMTSMSITGQVLGGFLGDKFSKQALAFSAMFGHAIAMLFLAFGTNLLSVLAFAVINGLAWGIRGPIMQAMRADYFGRKSYAQLMGYSSVIVTIGIIIGPLLAGIMADIFGSYTAGFTVLAACAALGSICFVFAGPPKLEPKSSSA